MNDSAAELEVFLAHSVEIEEDAMNRYQELAENMRSHNNLPVAEFFTQMAMESAKHLQEVQALVGDRQLPEIRPWDFDWPQEAPESASYEALHYRMDVPGAMQLALKSERAARDYYQHAAAHCAGETTRRLAQQFADEEAGHATRLEMMLERAPLSTPLHREDDDPPHSPE